jgi:uncharacterized protein (TIGR03086 family)
MDLRPFYLDALDNVQRVIGGIEPADFALPTPCADWDVRRLVGHVTGGVWRFAKAAAGEDVSAPVETVDAGPDPVSEFEAARSAAAESWGADGVLERTMKLHIGTMPATLALRIALMEAVVHAWDLAKATGQKHGIDPMVAAAMLSGLRQAITDDQRGPGKPFEPQVTIAEDAPMEEQLVAFLGRRP